LRALISFSGFAYVCPCVIAQQNFFFFLISLMGRRAARACQSEMLEKQYTERVGEYIVTPLTKLTDAGIAASVSIRRGMYERIFRFVPRFTCDIQAIQYALAQGRSMVQLNQLG